MKKYCLWAVALLGCFALSALENPVCAGHAGIWEFLEGREFPGASGGITASDDGVVRLTGDFRSGGRYVAARSAFTLPRCSGFRFKIRAGEARGFSLRIQDSAGQTHQNFYPIDGERGTWGEFVFVPGKEVSKAHWGGANDGVFRGAARSVTFVLGARELSGKHGGLELRDFELLDAESAAIALVAPDASDYFVAPDAAWFELDMAALSASAAAPGFRLLDYAGNTVGSGQVRLDRKARKIAIPLPGRPGFYEVQLPELGVTLGVVAAAVFSGEPDEYFGIDFSSSRSHLAEPVIRGMMRALTRNGVFWCRDRFGWEHLNPAPGTIDFNALDGRYEMLRRVAAEEAIRLLDVTHDAPGWNKRLRSERDNFLAGANTGKYSHGSNVYPRDLVAGAEAWSRILRHWPVTAAFEVWNEPDIRFGNYFPPEYVMALTRAVSWQLAADGVPTRVIGGCLAYPTAGLYGMLIRNGLLESADAMSFHTYKDVTAQEPVVEALRREEEKLAPEYAGFPCWVTESGMPWPSGTDRPTLAADRLSAREIVGKAIEFRALGMRKYFPFLIKYYTEPERNFGMFDRNMTPLRSIAAYFYAVGALAGTRYIGDLALPGAARCRVFAGRDGGSVACVYLVGGDTVLLPGGLHPESVRGADGRSLAKSGREIPVPDGVGYLYFAPGAIDRFLNCDVPAMRLWKLAAGYLERQRRPRPLVIQPDFDMTRLEYTNEGYFLAAGEVFELRTVLQNMGGSVLTVEPELTLPAGCRAEGAAPERIELPPRARVEYLRCFTVDETLPGDRFSVAELADRNGQGAPLAIALRRRTASTLKVSSGGEWVTFPAAGWKGGGTADIRASFRLGYTAETLRLEVAVADETHFCDFPPNRMWNGDSVQFAFALPRSGGGLDEALELEYLEFTAAQTPDQARLIVSEPADRESLAAESKFKFRREGQESFYTFELPAAAAGVKRFVPGTVVRFSLLVNSNNGAGRNGYLTWGGGIGDGKYPALFHELCFQ